MNTKWVYELAFLQWKVSSRCGGILSWNVVLPEWVENQDPLVQAEEFKLAALSTRCAADEYGAYLPKTLHRQ